MSAATAPRGWFTRLLINRNYALYWTGISISNFGDFVFSSTLLLWISYQIGHNQAWGPLAAGVLELCIALPTFLFGPIAGVFVDRWNKRRTMLLMDVLRAALILLLLPVSGVFPGRLDPLWQLICIYGDIFLCTLCTLLFSPARATLNRDIVPDERREQASSMIYSSNSTFMILAPLLAGILFFSAGAVWALLINAGSFLISFCCILAVQAPAEAKRSEQASLFQEFTSGVRYVTGNSTLRCVLVSLFLLMLGGGITNTLGPFFFEHSLHAAPALFPQFEAVGSAGLLLGALSATWGLRRLGALRTFQGGLVLMGIFELLFSRSTSLFPAFLLTFLTGICNSFLNTSVSPLAMRLVPREYLGRVFALIEPGMRLAQLISAPLAGFLISHYLYHLDASFLGLHFGPYDTLLGVSALLVLVSGLYACFSMRTKKNSVETRH